jgi:dTDP-4-amino-4,6-dideoxygalactose transaminase
MKVPLLDLKEQNEALASELRAAFERVLASGQFIQGPELQKFERQAAVTAGTRHAAGVSSGTDAILLALMALDIRAGDEVICPSFTFFATAGCVARIGAKPVFADSCPVCFNINVADARRRVTARTKAIMPVHLFGQAADMDATMELAREFGLKVIEDSAQAFGAEYRGRRVGSIGDFGTYSFFPSKNLGGFGDAGLLATNDDGLSAKAVLLRTHGAKPKYFHKAVGGNFRMDPLQAALLSAKLPHLEEYSRRRSANAGYYTERLSGLDGVAQPQVGEGHSCHQGEEDWGARNVRLLLPAADPRNKHIWNQYTLRVLGGKRNALRDFLASREIGSEIYYPRPMHMQECFQDGAPQPQLPVCERLAEECLSIPIYPELTRKHQDAVVEAIGSFLAESA